MRLPEARGPLSTAVLDTLAGPRAPDPAVVRLARERVAGTGDPAPDVLTDDDLQIALWTLYELHYLGFDDASEDWEWDPVLLAVRRELEAAFEAALRSRTEPHVTAALEAEGDVAGRLFAMAEEFDGPSVARFIHREADHDQLREFLVHRSVYHLKESDPSSWVIPRVTGGPKAALVELLYDEYGAGRTDRVHATMFGDCLEASGLDRTYGSYVDRVPGYTLANNNAMSLLGLHRRLRAAALGHLGAFEATSSLPSRKLAAGIRRLGLPEPAAAYFDEHVEADAVHEQLAFRDICAALAEQQPELTEDVFFGVAVCLSMDGLVGESMLSAWQCGESTLRQGEAEPAPGRVA